MTFSAIATVATLDEFLTPVAALVDECKLHLEPDGLEIRAVDAANVAMGDVRLDADALESYEVSAEEDDDAVIGINLSRFIDVIGFGDADELVELDLNAKTRKLDIQVGSMDYTLATIDPYAIRQEPNLPDLDLSAEIVFEGREFGRAVTAADMVSDHIAFGVDADPEQFYADAEGDTDDVHLELGRDELIALEAGDAHSLFSLDYCEEMNQAIPNDSEVRMELGQEFPFKLHLDIADGDGSVTYLLAPRIQSE